MDTDGNGTVDSTEFSAAAQKLASASDSSSSATDIFSMLDTNSDGAMSTEELVSSMKEMRPPEPPLGEITGGTPPPPPPPSEESLESSESSNANEVFSALDTNQDGSISPDELMALFGDSSENSEITVSTEGTSAQKTTGSDTMRNNWLEKVLSYYGNNASSSSAESLLSISA